MKRLLLLLLLVASSIRCGPVGVVLEAQTLPYAAMATWDALPSAVSYTATLDGGAPTTTMATACSPTLCTMPVPVPSFGAHTFSIVANYLILSTDPSTTTPSAAVVVPFTLNQAGQSTKNVVIKKGP